MQIKKIALLRWCIWLVKKIWQYQNSVVMTNDPNLQLPLSFWCCQNFFDKPNASSQKNNFFYCIWLAQKIWKHQNSVVMAD
ncbi:unnamed protein product [Blepharisma stoltei]|uniref:Uncharacterized protein n=1 Tax=Blepharisma stoltei TaxID=1481888 RepID=A0AAU9JEN4_9CILI|nr:unnamed protein product [Blepharisma stoltei]